MANVKMRAKEISKAIFSIEVIIENISSAFEENVIGYQSPEYELCDGYWTLTIFKVDNKFIHYSFEKTDNGLGHFKGVILCRLARYYTVHTAINCIEGLEFVKNKFHIKIFPFSKNADRAKSLKTILVIACPTCQKKSSDTEILPEWILPIYEVLQEDFEMDFPKDESKRLRPLDKNNRLKEKHPEETGEFPGSKMKLSSSSGIQDRRKRNFPEDVGEFSDSEIKWVRPPGSGVRKRLERICAKDERIISASKLKWFHSSGADALRKDINSSLSSVEDFDVIIAVQDREFRAHKNILREKSPVFESMFTHDMAEKNSGTIRITDCEPDAFEHFLVYLYSGKMKHIPQKVVLSLYYIGDKYDVEEVKNICIEHISKYLTVQTFFDVATLSSLHKGSLLEATGKFFVKKRTEITATDTWISFLREHPMTGNELYEFASCDSSNSVWSNPFVNNYKMLE